MSALLVSLFAKFWPAIIGVAGVAGGALFGWIKTKGADAKVAAAGEKAATAQTQVAQVQASAAEANAAAATAGTDAAAARTAIDNDVSAKPARGVKDELANDWTRS